MSITFVPMSPADTDDLIGFLTSNRFPFHVQAAPQAADARAKIANSHFWNEDTQGYWVVKVELRALCDMVFDSMPNTLRFEGQTREDNIAMRKIFLRADFLKETHYRLGWPTNDGGHVASIAYAILCQDWENGTVTHFEWNDLKIQNFVPREVPATERSGLLPLAICSPVAT